MTSNSGILSWNIEAVAEAFGVSAPDVIAYFTDGRRISFILERRIANEVLQGKLAPSEGSCYDVEDANNGKWEVRSLTRGGMYFCPSGMIGKDRCFEESGFIEKLNAIDGYIIADIECFPNIPFWFISSAMVRKWWLEGNLGAATITSRKRVLALIKIIYH